MRDPSERLRDILEAIDAIERYAARGVEAFRGDELVQVWILHHLLIIGEAAARLGRDFHAQYPNVPWARTVAMRNVLIHQYFGVDVEEIWNTVEGDLPAFKRSIETLMRELPPHHPSPTGPGQNRLPRR